MNQNGGNSHCKERKEISPWLQDLKFPRFQGDEVHDWIFQADNYFSCMETSAHMKVEVASRHLFGDALQWFKGKMKRRGDSLWGWEDFSKSIVTRFSPRWMDDPLGKLKILKQTEEVESYVNQFCTFCAIIDIAEDHAKCLFLAGLKPEISHIVRMRKPPTFDDAVRLAFSTELGLPSFRAMALSFSTTYPTNQRPSFNPREGCSGFTKSTNTRFSPRWMDDPLRALLNLKQTAEVERYVNQFNVLYDRIDIPDDHGKSFFLAGLKPELAQFLGFFEPQTFDDAVDLAFSAEAAFHSLRTMAWPSTGDEEQDISGYGDVEEEVQREGEVCQVEPKASLYAIHNIRDSKMKKNVMPVVLQIKKRLIHTLIDTESTHNLISKRLAEAMGFPIFSTNPVRITVANGETLITTESCWQMEWSIQGRCFDISAYVLPLLHYDAVLGMEWLESESLERPVFFDFKRKEIRLLKEGKELVLKGC